MFRQPIGWLSSQIGHFLEFSNCLFKRQISCTLPRNFLPTAPLYDFTFPGKACWGGEWWQNTPLLAQWTMRGEQTWLSGDSPSFPVSWHSATWLSGDSQCFALSALPLVPCRRLSLNPIDWHLRTSHRLSWLGIALLVNIPNFSSGVALHCCLFPKTLLLLSFCFYAFMIMIQVVVVTFLFLNGARVQKCLKGSL